MSALANKTVLMLASNGFAELFEPRQALLDACATVTLAAPDLHPIDGVAGTVQSSMVHQSIQPDLRLEDVDVAQFDALVLPGGIGNPDRLRINSQAIGIVRQFAAEGKLVAAICHAPWLLIEADLVRGRQVTSWLSLHTDLRNAGAVVLDAAVVTDGNILTGRMPEDLPEFNAALIAALSHQASRSAD